ncbi:MAG: arylesterase [Alphaproteobacteria bacterium]
MGLFMALFASLTASHAASAEIKLLALGDSLVAGYGLDAQDSFPFVLQQRLVEEGFDAMVINGGVSGDTSRGGLSRLDWLFADNPDLMLVELGANDGLRGLPPEDTEANLRAILERARDENLPVILAGMMAPPNLGRDYSEAFNAVYPRLAAEFDVFFYPFFLDGVAAEMHLNQSDGMHPNADGVDVIVDRILPTVVEAIRSLDAE